MPPPFARLHSPGTCHGHLPRPPFAWHLPRHSPGTCHGRHAIRLAPTPFAWHLPRRLPRRAPATPAPATRASATRIVILLLSVCAVGATGAGCWGGLDVDPECYSEERIREGRLHEYESSRYGFQRQADRFHQDLMHVADVDVVVGRFNAGNFAPFPADSPNVSLSKGILQKRPGLHPAVPRSKPQTIEVRQRCWIKIATRTC